MPGMPIEPGEGSEVPFDVGAARSMPAMSIGERIATLRHEPRVVTVFLAVVALAIGGWWVRSSTSEPSGALAPAHPTSTTRVASYSPSSLATSTSTTATGVLVVDVVGAVNHPGVVSMPSSARVVDAVTAAGGARPNADLDRINLAAHLVDGMRIAVPRRGFPADAAGPSADPGGSAPSGGGAGGAPTAEAPVDLNTATQAQLEALPGIGPSLAQAILQERAHEGGFHSVDDLRRVHGIGDVRFAQLRPLVTV